MYLPILLLIHLFLRLFNFLFIFLQLLTLAQDVENELKTQVVQAERVDEKKFSMFLFCSI